MSVIAGSLLLGACVSDGPIAQAPGLNVVRSAEMPAPTAADFQPSEKPYLVGPLDTLIIDIMGYDDFKERNVQVDASGRVAVPMAGVIEAAGHSPGQIASEIEAGLRHSYFRNPHVTVNLKETESQTVTVEGEVTQPGIYPIVHDMTLLRALAAAKGSTDTSKLENVMIFRTVNGQSYAGLYNVKAIRQGNYADPRIYPNDTVVVSQSRARKLFKDFLQLAPLLSSPLIIALQKY
jgi:polysaccharide export outer membrane protein